LRRNGCASANIAEIPHRCDFPGGLVSERFERRQDESTGHQQARRYIFAHAADPWRASGIRYAERKADAQGWLHKLIGRRNKNVAVVALANKNARIVWALLARDREFRSDYAAA
jgi:hypothetical protein